MITFLSRRSYSACSWFWLIGEVYFWSPGAIFWVSIWFGFFHWWLCAPFLSAYSYLFWILFYLLLISRFFMMAAKEWISSSVIFRFGNLFILHVAPWLSFAAVGWARSLPSLFTDFLAIFTKSLIYYRIIAYLGINFLT